MRYVPRFRLCGFLEMFPVSCQAGTAKSYNSIYIRFFFFWFLWLHLEIACVFGELPTQLLRLDNNYR